MVPTLLVCGLLLAACESGGGISGSMQSCSTSRGFLEDTEVTCSGTVETLSGSIGVEFGDGEVFEENTGDTQRLRATFTTESGTARLTAPGPKGAVELGTLRAGRTLTVDKVVAFDDFDNSIGFDAGEGGRLEGIEYRGTASPL